MRIFQLHLSAFRGIVSWGPWGSGPCAPAYPSLSLPQPMPLATLNPLQFPNHPEQRAWHMLFPLSDMPFPGLPAPGDRPCFPSAICIRCFSPSEKGADPCVLVHLSPSSGLWLLGVRDPESARRPQGTLAELSQNQWACDKVKRTPWASVSSCTTGMPPASSPSTCWMS